MSVDSDGNLLVTGTFTDSLDLGRGAMTAGPNPQMFVAKLDPSGVAIWGRQIAGRNLASTALVADSSGGLVFAVRLFGTIDFGNGPVGSPETEQALVARWDAAGKHLWSRNVMNAFDRIVLGLDGSDNVVAASTGEVDSAFPCGTPMRDVVMFVTKIKASGEPSWTRLFGPKAINSLMGALLIVRPDGSSMVAGGANAGVDFGQGVVPMGCGYWNFLIGLTP
jgi:hypothetical protein